MNFLTRPYWIYLTVTLPQCLIILYYQNLYTIVSSQLTPTNLENWVTYGAALGLMITSATLYGGFLQLRGGNVPWWYGLLTLTGYLVLLYSFYRDFRLMLPNTLQPWMFSEAEVNILPIGLVMPSLIYALLLLVDHATPADRRTSLTRTAIGAVMIPAIWYLGIRLLFPLLRGVLDWKIHGHLQMVIYMILCVAFMFLLMRLVYQLILKLPQTSLRNRWLIKLPFTILLPLTCLLVYNGVVSIPGGEWIGKVQIIGDWSHPFIYALAAINGVALTLPESHRYSMRLAAFIVKALCYPIVAYFFVVFLPFFPFALSTIFLLGVGFLLLAPLLLFFFHTWSLYRDWTMISGRFGRAVPLLVMMGSIAVVPSAVILAYGTDRSTLDTMLEHLYEPDYGSKDRIEVDMGAVTRVLDHIRMVKQGRDFLNGKRKPYLDSFYQWLVMDNLTLSERRLGELERVFLGSPVAKDHEQFRMVLPLEKASLQRYMRTPYLHFIVDRSASAEHSLDTFSRRIDDLRASRQLLGVGMEDAVVSLVNYNALSLPLESGWKREAEQFKAEGGFFLEQAVKRSLATNFWRRADRYPLFVVVTDQMEAAIFNSGMADFNITMPEGDEFLLLSERGEVSLRRFSSPREEVIASDTFSPASRHVLAWPNRSSPVAYLPDNGDATLLLKQKHIDYTKLKLEGKNWENGMKLAAMWQHSKLDPRGSAEKHYTLIANSFRTGLMTPLTAYLSPESELQRKLLRRKQSQVLASMRPLDVGEEYEMNEPPLWVIALLTSIVMLWRALLKRGSETDQSNARVMRKIFS